MQGLFMFGVIFLAFLVAIPSFVLRGFVLMMLWKWFIVPIGVSPLSFVPAVGCVIIFGFLCKTPRVNKKKSIKESLIELYLEPMMVLFCGWILYKVLVIF